MKTYTPEELQAILEKHRLWLDGDPGGERADLANANLRGADLQYVHLQCANLRGADLQGANLRGANLLGADLDYSVLPLWCGSLYAHFDDRQLRQIAYHLVQAGLHSKNANAETKAALRQLIPFANGFHRVRECGKIKEDEP